MIRKPQNRHISDVAFFVTTNTLHHQPFFAESTAAGVVLDTLQFFREKKEIELYGYVIMPDHIHLVLRPLAPATLPTIMRRFKSYVAHVLARGPVWQDGYFSAGLPTETVLRQKLEYMLDNPVRAGLSVKPEDYEWSSAREWTQQRRGVIDTFAGPEYLAESEDSSS